MAERLPQEWEIDYEDLSNVYARAYKVAIPSSTEVFREFDGWVAQFAAFVSPKGKIEPGKYRAYDYQAPDLLTKDLKLKWREVLIGLGYPPAGSAPAEQ